MYDTLRICDRGVYQISAERERERERERESNKIPTSFVRLSGREFDFIRYRKLCLFRLKTNRSLTPDLRFYVLFNSISVISGRRADDNDRICAMEPRLRLRRFRLERGSNSGPLDQQASS